MTFTETEIRYIEWDYDSMTAVEYKRYGECNQCGECCKANIVFRGRSDGGGGPDEEGVWSEVQANQKRMYFKTKTIDLENENICPSYNDKQGCKIHNELNAICAVWPYTPCDVALLPMCSYWFDEINSWKIE